MIVQAVCLPAGSKMLVIPIFLPIIPFIVCTVCSLQDYWDNLVHSENRKVSIPVCYRPFPLWGSTGSKQTLNGLFYVNAPELFSMIHRGRTFLRDDNVLIYKNLSRYSHQGTATLTVTL